MGEKKKGILSRLGEFGPFKPIANSIRNKLLLALLCVTLVTLFAVGGIGYWTSSNSLRQQTFDNLKSTETNKAQVIERFFQDRENDMRTLSQNVYALSSAAFKKLEAVQSLKIKQIESAIRTELQNISILADTNIVSTSVSAFRAVDGEVGGPEWEAVNQARGPWFVQYADDHGYHDILFVEPDGKVIYSVKKGPILGENLRSEDYAESQYAEAYQEGLEGFTVKDMDLNDEVYTLYVSKPVKALGETVGVIVVRVPIKRFEPIVQERAGLESQSESYLVGRVDDIDSYRSSRVVKEGRIGDLKFSENVIRALSGLSDQTYQVSEEGVFEITNYAPLKIAGLNWALITTARVDEIISPEFQDTGMDLFTVFQRDYGYENLYLFSPDGYLFYSVESQVDRNTNFINGPFKNTNLGRLVQQIMEIKKYTMVDFEKYAPSGNAYAAFIGIPVLSEVNEVDMIVAAQLSTDQINQVMSQRTGLRQSGEAYLVGPDHLFRSDSRFLEELGFSSTIMNSDIPVNSVAVRSALAGNEGIDVIDSNYRGKKVLSAWSPITVAPPTEANPNGIKWAAIAEINLNEVMQPVYNMLKINGIVIVVVLLVVILAAAALSRSLTDQVNRIMDLFSEIGMGNFEARTEVTAKDELGTMAMSLNAMLDNTLSLIQSSEERDRMQRSVMKLLDEISGFAEGDLTSRAEVTEDFSGAIADAFNDMAEQLSRVVRNVKDVTIQVTATSHQVTASTENLAETSELQANQVAEAVTAINEMLTSIQQVAENAAQSAQVSEKAMVDAKEGAEAVRKTNEAMDSIREHAQETARAIKRLGESSQEIGNIVQLINDIADRTSILALNASIQAAMAGDAGRGFAVVAEEVQRLAERSTNATQQIDTLIKNIQGEINEAGISMEESIGRVVDGSQLADDAYRKLQEIENVSESLGELIRSITLASKQQARASENIAKTMGEVGEISSQTSAAGRETAVSMKNLAEMSEQLNISVDVFKLGEEEPEIEDMAAANDIHETGEGEEEEVEVEIEEEEKKTAKA